MVMSRLFHTIGFATTHVVVCKTLYHLKDSHCIGENKKFTDGVECGASIHAIFQLTVGRIWMFFSLKHSQSQGKSSFKISGCWGLPFWRS